MVRVRTRIGEFSRRLNLSGNFRSSTTGTNGQVGEIFFFFLAFPCRLYSLRNPIKLPRHSPCESDPLAAGSHMTKRKHASTSVAANRSVLSARPIRPNLPLLDGSASSAAEKKAKVCEGTDKAVVPLHTASEDLDDIDDIFRQARHQKQAPVATKKVCVLLLDIASYSAI